MTDTVKRVGKSCVVEGTEDREKLWAIQTPQAFDVRLLKRAYEAVVEQQKEVTDDASAVELIGEPVKIYETEKPNLKITTVEDLRMAAAIVLK